MSTFLKFTREEPPIDPDATEKIVPPVFPLAGMSAMVTLVSPEGRTHWVRRNSMAYRVMKSHGYRVGGAS